MRRDFLPGGQAPVWSVTTIENVFYGHNINILKPKCVDDDTLIFITLFA